MPMLSPVFYVSARETSPSGRCPRAGSRLCGPFAGASSRDRDGVGADFGGRAAALLTDVVSIDIYRLMSVDPELHRRMPELTDADLRERVRARYAAAAR